MLPLLSVLLGAVGLRVSFSLPYPFFTVLLTSSFYLFFQRFAFIEMHPLSFTWPALKNRKIFVIIDKIGDKKKGRSTDYVSLHYLGLAE
jgi:hypothetical protein